MKKHALALAVSAICLLPQATMASGIPTIDVANLAQNIVDYSVQLQQIDEAVTQVQQGIQQIEEARNQVLEAKRSFDSINGIRDLGSLLNSEIYRDAREYLPTNWQQTLALGKDIEGGKYSSLKGALEATKQASRIYDRDTIGLSTDSQPLKTLDAYEEVTANETTVAGATYDRATQRRAELQTFIDRINTSADQKSTLDLQARIQAENAMLQNEMLATMAQQQLADAKRAELANQRRERKIYLSHVPFDDSALVAAALSAEGLSASSGE